MLGFFHTQQKMYALAILFNINILKNVVFITSLFNNFNNEIQYAETISFDFLFPLHN